MFLKGQMKGFWVGAAVTLTMTSTVFAAGNLKQIQVNFNTVKKIMLEDEELKFTGKNIPLIYNGSVYIPIRPLFEQFGHTVNWNAKTGIIKITQHSSQDTQTGDEANARNIQKALTAYIVDSGDTNLKLFGDGIDVDTILIKLQSTITDPVSGHLFGPYLLPVGQPDTLSAAPYYPIKSKGWEIIIDCTAKTVSVRASDSNHVTFNNNK